jgi:glycosyltransferase involved in cell wall biosynthesis
MAKLGIRMINIDFYPLLGGAQMHTLRVSRFLSEKGVDVEVITRHHPGLARQEAIDGIPVYRTPIWHRSKVIASLSFTFYALRQLIASRGQFQVIHSHEMLSPMTIGLIACKLLGTKLVVNPHRGGYLGDMYKLTTRRPLTGKLRLSWVRRRGDAFVTCSREMAAELEAGGIAKEKIHVIPNAIYTNQFRPVEPGEKVALREQLGMPDGVWACYAGRLSAEKGLNLLLQVWAKVIQQVTTAHLLIVGDGDQRPALEALTRQLGLDEHVRFTGSVPETLQYLQACDLYVQPSYTEGLPVSMLEAMACGLPVLATGVGGVTDILADGKNGLVIPARDADSLEEGLCRLLSSEALRLRLGAQARQDVVAYCDIEQVGQALLNLYCQLAAGAPLTLASSTGSGI